MSILKSSLISLLTVLPIFTLANEMSEAEAQKLAKAAQNPIASMISLPLQNNTNLNIGPNDSTQNILNVQPVWPFEINDDWNLITRTIIPVVSNPSFLNPDGDRLNGLGDTLFTAFVAPSSASTVTWGVGPVLLIPTATDTNLGQDTWAGGISGIVLASPGKWVIGSVVSNIWAIGGGEADINFFTWQYFVNYNLSDGWYLVTAPIITADWEKDGDHKWTVPFGAGAGKIFKIGKQAINAQVSVYNNVITPDDYGSEWQVRAQFQFMFPK